METRKKIPVFHPCIKSETLKDTKNRVTRETFHKPKKLASWWDVTGESWRGSDSRGREAL